SPRDDAEAGEGFTRADDHPRRIHITAGEPERDGNSRYRGLARPVAGRPPESPPPAFERLCQRLLREEGFIKVEVTGHSGDGGIDGIGILRVSMLAFPVFFQCKRYKGSVGAGAVRDFRGAM